MVSPPPPGSKILRHCPAGAYYYQPGGGLACRCIICPRCGQHTGNTNQGHYWSLCKKTHTFREHHFCCPGDCELEEQR